MSFFVPTCRDEESGVGQTQQKAPISPDLRLCRESDKIGPSASLRVTHEFSLFVKSPLGEGGVAGSPCHCDCNELQHGSIYSSWVRMRFSAVTFFSLISVAVNVVVSAPMKATPTSPRIPRATTVSRREIPLRLLLRWRHRPMPLLLSSCIPPSFLCPNRCALPDLPVLFVLRVFGVRWSAVLVSKGAGY